MSGDFVATKHIVLEVEVPSLYAEDIEQMGADLQEEVTSDFILNTCGEPGPCILSTEVSGDKDSEVITVWGSIRGAKLVEPDRGYGPGPVLTEDQLEEAAGHKLAGDPADVLRVAIEKLRAAGVDLDDLIDDVDWELNRLKREKARDSEKASS